MSKRIAVLVPFAFDETGLAGRRQQQQSVSWGEGIEFTYVPVSAGPQWYENYHDWILADLAMLECALRIQNDGYDAICIDTMSDSGVNAIRCELDIPVIGPGRTSYMTALMLGNKFGVLTQWGPWAAIYKKGIGELGLMDKCAGIRHIDTPPDVVNLLGGKEEVVFPLLLAEAQRCIEDGADVICLGSTTMHQAHSFLTENLPVPVINPGPLSYAIAHLLLATGLSQSHAAYIKPEVPKLGMTAAMLAAAQAYEAGA
jgi:allantoin racemase